MTVVQKVGRAGDLPPEWAKEFADPSKKVVIRIDELDDELARAETSIEVFDILANRARSRGLTEEILEEILNERS